MEPFSKWGGICSVSEHFQRKAGQALERLLFFIGSRIFCSKITSDQPKGLPGLMSRAEDKGKGKGKTCHFSIGVYLALSIRQTDCGNVVNSTQFIWLLSITESHLAPLSLSSTYNHCYHHCNARLWLAPYCLIPARPRKTRDQADRNWPITTQRYDVMLYYYPHRQVMYHAEKCF